MTFVRRDGFVLPGLKPLTPRRLVEPTSFSACLPTHTRGGLRLRVPSPPLLPLLFCFCCYWCRCHLFRSGRCAYVPGGFDVRAWAFWPTSPLCYGWVLYWRRFPTPMNKRGTAVAWAAVAPRFRRSCAVGRKLTCITSSVHIYVAYMCLLLSAVPSRCCVQYPRP